MVLGALAFAAISSAVLTPVAAVAGAAKNTAEDWTLTRISIDYTKEGIELNQLEMGIPDNQAVAILEVPFDNTESFEIKFRVTMDDYVASGRNANDVWTGIGIMGVPNSSIGETANSTAGQKIRRVVYAPFSAMTGIFGPGIQRLSRRV